MAVPGRDRPVLTGRDLGTWLRREVSPRLPRETEVVAHGGTALTQLRLKASTKDVDFGFRARGDFDRFVAALESAGYRITRDFRPNPQETYLRLERSGASVPAVDVRFPTWNNWRLTDLVLRRARVISQGRVRVVLPDRDAMFLFKMYPLRQTDVDDLRGVIDRSPPDEARIIALFDEQDGIHRADLAREDIEHKPLFNILELRVRFAGSCDLLGARYRAAVPRIARHARVKFRELRLRRTLPRLVSLLQDPNRLVNWNEVVGGDADRLRARLGGDRAGPG